MDVLAKLFSSAARVKLMRFFLLNPETTLGLPLLANRTRLTKSALRRELNLLKSIRFLGSKKVRERGRKWSRGFVLNQNFIFAGSLKYLLVNTGRFSDREIIERLKKWGHLKLVIVAGLFLGQPNSRLDILIVGDHLKRKMLVQALRKMEVEIGRELDYAILDTAEFKYRYDVYDKFIRDILDYPHRRVLDKFGLAQAS